MHKKNLFLEYISKTLNIVGKLFSYRIRNDLTYSKKTKTITLDKSILIRIEIGRHVKEKNVYEI